MKWNRIADRAVCIMNEAPFLSSVPVLALTVTLVALGSPEVTEASASGNYAFQVRQGQAQFTPALSALFDSDQTSADGRAVVWLYLRDKEIFDSETCERAALAHAKTLTPASRKRRSITSGQAWVDFYDLPVSENYVATLKELGLDVRQESRWLNAVSVNISRSQLEAALDLPFLSDAKPVRKGTSDRNKVSSPRSEVLPPVSRGGGDPFDYGPSRPQNKLIQALPAHAAGYSGAGVIVAVFDTGFFLDHEAFTTLRSEGRLLDQYDFVNDDGNVDNEPNDNPFSNGHGTGTWSAVGGLVEGNLVGVAHGASFLLCKTEDINSETPVEEDNWVAAAEWAEARGAQVFSTSLNYVSWYEYEDLDGDTAPMSIASDIAASRGIVVCVAAGNLGAAPWHYIGVPADADSVLAVGAVDTSNLLAEWSGRGPTADGRIKPEVVAHGVDTYVASADVAGDVYFHNSGTSLATPLVAGAAALVIEAHPDWTGWQVRESILRTAVSFTIPNNERGYGLIDTWGAISDTPPPAEPSPDIRPTIHAWPTPSSGSVQFQIDVPQVALRASTRARAEGSDSDFKFRIFDSQGRQVRAAATRKNEWEWDGEDQSGKRVTPGIYFVRASTADWQSTQKIVIRP